MDDFVLNLGLILLVAVFWGATNPFIEKAVTVQKQKFRPFDFSLRSFGNLVLRIRFAIPFLINQFGSIFYIYVLGRVPAQYCSVLTNSLTCLITLVVEQYLSKRKYTLRTVLGMGLIVLGIPLVLTPATTAK